MSPAAQNQWLPPLKSSWRDGPSHPLCPCQTCLPPQVHLHTRPLGLCCCCSCCLEFSSLARLFLPFTRVSIQAPPPQMPAPAAPSDVVRPPCSAPTLPYWSSSHLLQNGLLISLLFAFQEGKLQKARRLSLLFTAVAMATRREPGTQ